MRAEILPVPAPSPAPATTAAADAAAPTAVVVASLTKSLVNFRFELLAGIRAAGYRVVAVAPDEDAAAERALAGIGVGLRRVPLARAGLTPFGDLAYLARLVRLLREERPAIVIAYTAKPVIYAGLAARLAGTRFVPLMTGLGYVFADEGPSARKALVRALTVRLYRAALKRAPAVPVYNTDDAADIVRHRMAPAGRLLAVPGSGVNLDRFGRQPLPDGPPVFLMIARLLRDKGVFEFIEAARLVKAEHPEARFRLVGPFDPNPTAIAPDELAAAVADGAVEYAGEAHDVRPHLAACSVFVLPTYYREGVPRTLLEAMATGRALVTTDSAACRQTVDDGRNGILVPPRDAAALAAAMARLAADRDLVARMGEESHALARRRFDVAAVNRTLLDAMGIGGR